MEVTFKSNQMLGNKLHKAGRQVVKDHLAANIKFKALVKTGQVIVHARDQSAQAMQASKDLMNAKKAEVARKLTIKMEADKAAKAASDAADKANA